MKPTVYIETTIPSFYHTKRTDSESAAMHEWTSEWWDTQKDDFHLFTSAAVLLEIESGESSLVTDRLKMLKPIPLLQITDEALHIAGIYIERFLMPADEIGDALHLALASCHKCDILLIWNCRHLANYNKIQHIRRLNVALGIHIPELLTPLELVSNE